MKMASWSKLTVNFRRSLYRLWSMKNSRLGRCSGIFASVAIGGGLIYQRFGPSLKYKPYIVHAAEDVKGSATSDQSPRRQRFNHFSSVMFEEEPYMTPRDFLFSVMLESVDRKVKQKILTKQEVNEMLTRASKAKPGNNLFRNLGDKGLISYTEYLFLLTILMKPHTGFHIAFKMLDVDGNEHVDKKEFLKLKKIIRKERVSKEEAPTDGEVDTTLQAFFFGKKGTDKLQYKEFCRFMEDLQAEVQEMEFLQFSKGMETMRREDFAEWLLHYTNEEDNKAYWENMRKMITPGQSITFEEFKSFCLFTNNLEDFAFSVKMITEANRPIGMAEFKRAVKIATGNDLSENVLDTVFKLFDLDGDNRLSHKEFIEVMHDRIFRGMKVQPENRIPDYWRCVKRETLKGAQEVLQGTRGRI